jgi:magnesium-protoporphyrin O-methyltransferase
VLLAALEPGGVAGKSLLDIGGGVGAIQHELVEAGVARVTDVDASTAYLEVVEQEATRRGYADRAAYHHGDFVELASELDAADIVTLDRVICCYPDMDALVGLSSARARLLYGLVYPRRTWYLKLARPLINAFFRLRRNPFRFFLHKSEDVDAVARRSGLSRASRQRSGVWNVVVYRHAA